jgi:multimeric flavodoxin WrbA
MPKLWIIYHSQTGNTERLARAALKAAHKEEGTDTELIRAFDADADTLWSADGLIFATPENFGYMSGALKDFFDRTYDETHEEIRKLPYGILISAGNDGRGARREIKRIIEGYGFELVAEPVIARGDIDDEALEQAAELGQALAAGLDLGIF